MEYSHYDIFQDAIVVERADGTKECHRCGSTNSYKKRDEVWDRLKRDETGWYERYPLLVRKV